MNIISFSLYGKIPKYTLGAIENVIISKDIYPGWVCRFYVADDVPNDIIHKLENAGSQIYKMGKNYGISGMFWRFLPAGDHDVEVMISRDCDSLINVREKAAVEEWLGSEYPFHVMRDHPHHGTNIMAGMWGCKKGILAHMKQLIDNWERKSTYYDDGNFLGQIIWPIIKNNHMAHDDLFDISGALGKKFPVHKKLPDNIAHVGSVINRK